MRRTITVVLGTLALLFSIVPAAAAWEPVGGGLFNNPFGTKAAKWRIINHVNKAVRETPRGETILISTFLMDSKASADALIAAHDNRNVRVRIVTDRVYADTYQMRRLIRRFNADNLHERPLGEDGQPVSDEVWHEVRWGPDGSFVVQCNRSCRGRSVNNHSKFYVFSKTGTAENVTMVSSSNLNAGGAVKGWNDLFVVKNSFDLFRDYSIVHNQMAEDEPRAYEEFHSGAYVSRFYPKHSGGDPVMADLSNVRCRGTTGGAGRNGRTLINVAMFAWNSTVGMNIADRLIRLDRDGCDVQIVYGAPSKLIREKLAANARRGGVKLWDSRYNRDRDPEYEVRTHHKYMLINGRYGADSSSWRVHTGSRNWGRGTLGGGDENTLNVVGRSAWRQYMDNWLQLTRASRRIHR